MATIPLVVIPVFAVSPPFGHQEMRDELLDIIELKCLIQSNDTTLHCGSTEEGNQSIDIRAIDYFSNGKTLDSTIWLLTEMKNQSLNYVDIPNYGAFIDADSNLATGWQGIDYQLETVWNNGTWKNILNQFSTSGANRTLEEKNETKFFEVGKNYVLMSLNLSDIGSPEKFKVMYYAEDKKRDDSVWQADFSSWIDVPRAELQLSTTPSSLEYRPNDDDMIGIQFSSTTGSANVSDIKVGDSGVGIQIENLSADGNPYWLKIPDKISPGRYDIPIVGNITKESSIPRVPFLVNKGYSLEQRDLPVVVQRPFTGQELMINVWKDWGPIIGFAVGVATGNVGTAIAKSIWKRLSPILNRKAKKK